jgi:hypothetical protein
MLGGLYNLLTFFICLKLAHHLTCQVILVVNYAILATTKISKSWAISQAPCDWDKSARVVKWLVQSGTLHLHFLVTTIVQSNKEHDYCSFQLKLDYRLMSQAHTYSTLIWGSRGGNTWSHTILLHIQMSRLKWPKFWDYQSPFLKLKHFDFEG